MAMQTCYTQSINSSASEISRLLVAAVINQKFRKLLLTQPEKALAAGFNGERFRIPTEQKKLILEIKAKTLEEFASEIAMKQERIVA